MKNEDIILTSQEAKELIDLLLKNIDTIEWNSGRINNSFTTNNIEIFGNRQIQVNLFSNILTVCLFIDKVHQEMWFVDGDTPLHKLYNAIQDKVKEQAAQKVSLAVQDINQKLKNL